MHEITYSSADTYALCSMQLVSSLAIKTYINSLTATIIIACSLTPGVEYESQPY